MIPMSRFVVRKREADCSYALALILGAVMVGALILLANAVAVLGLGLLLAGGNWLLAQVTGPGVVPVLTWTQCFAAGALLLVLRYAVKFLK